jgi:glycosyltransferase involved in cell wall biosynthesis
MQRREEPIALNHHVSQPRILALIPAYNEERAVGEVVSRTLPHLPVLVVDDGSTDATATRAEASGASVLRRTPNQGKGTALKAGFARALEQGFEAVLTLDADGQHDPSEIPKFLEARAASGADLVIGARDFGRMPLVRRIANTLGRRAFSWALGREIRDNQSGYRLVSARLAERLLAGRESGFEFEMEMIVTCVKSGLRLEWVPIRTIYAGEGSHIQSIPHLLGFLGFVRRTRRAVRDR